jgi:hypothetical protein
MQSAGGHGALSSRALAVARSRTFGVLAVGVLLGTLLVSVAGGQPAGAAYGPSYCSGYRWDVKTGQDPQASQVNLGSVTPTTVGFLTSLPAQPNLPDDSRLSPTELTQYEITGTIVDSALQHDNDYHVVIKDNSSNNVMITEIPDPACVPSSSPFASMIANARNEITSNAAIGATVAIKGVGFFDSNTLTSNVAPNKIELHPALDINFNPGSPPPTNYFTMSASPGSVSVMQGQSVTTSITTQVTGGSSQGVTLSASGLPKGATASFSPNSINSGQSSTLTIVPSASTPTGTYTINVKGSGTSTTHYMSMILTVTARNDFSLGSSANSIDVFQGESGTTTITSAVTNGSAQTVSLGASGLPPGATALFSPSSIAVGASSTMTIRTSPSTPVGDDYAVSVTATGPSAIHTTPISLGVDPAPISLGIGPAPSYWTVASDGGIFSFGGAHFYGSMGGHPLNRPIVGIGSTPDGGGYWLVASDGGIFSFGDAGFFGSTGNIHLNQPIVGMAASPSGHGYWLVASDGGIFSFGDAGFFGSTGNIHLNQPIVGMAASPSGHGYWLVASDGGIFSFGDAGFSGSTGNIHLNRPIVGMAASPSGHGYWLVASDGGIFSFGDAGFFGSTGNIHLNQPIVGMAASPSGHGYWLIASDGGIFSFGDAGFFGSVGGQPLNAPMTGMATA